MSTLEDRLSAALAARADLVRPEDLRESSVPQTPRGWRRPATVLLGVAACSAAIAAPFLIHGAGDDRPSPAPATQSPTQSPTQAPVEVEGADWPRVAGSTAYDVDGDGEPDKVVTRTETGENLTQDPWRIEVQLSSGGVAAVLLSGKGWENGLIKPVDLDRDGSDEILYYNGQESVEQPEIGVLDLVGGGLVDLRRPLDPGITSQPDAQFHNRGWWVVGRDLFSYRTVDGGFVPGTSNAEPPPYPVDTWQWTLRGGELVPIPQDGKQCLRAKGPDRPQPC